MKSPKGKVNRQVVEKTTSKSALSFKHLSQTDAQELLEILDLDDFNDKVAALLNIDDVTVELKNGIILDYHVSALWWARQQGYDAERLSGIFTIIHLLLENVKEKAYSLSLGDNLLFLKQLLSGIGIEEVASEEGSSTGGLEFFSIEEAAAITAYLSRTIFQHHLLFTFIFTQAPSEIILGTDLILEVPPKADLPYPPPLLEAMDENDYFDFIKTPRSSDMGLLGDRETIAEMDGEDTSTTSGPRKLTADELLSLLTPDEVAKVIEEVCQSMLGGVETEVAAKLREKENAFINRINSIHCLEP